MIQFFLIVIATFLGVGVIVWGIRKFPNIDDVYRQGAIVVITMGALLWLLYKTIGFVNALPSVR